jgi:hypothetical protein
MTTSSHRSLLSLPLVTAALAAALCTGTAFGQVSDEPRLDFLLARALERPAAARAEVINLAVNQFEHADSTGPTVWQSPQQLVQRGAGDCKDFALAKYWLLRHAGTPREAVRFGYGDVLLQGQWRPHLVVLLWPDAGSPLVLDNMVDGVYRLSDRPDLRIGFSFDEQAFYDETSERRIRDQPIKGWQGLWERLPKPAPIKVARRP